MTPVTDRNIHEMTDRIVREIKPEKIILFGSRAKGKGGPASDVDLVIVEKGPFNARRSRHREMVRIWELLSSFPFPKDILVYSRDEFDYWSDSLNHLIGRVRREGRVLYDRP